MRYLLLAFIALGVVHIAPARAERDDSILYTFKNGDTLIGLGRSHLLRSDDYKIVQKANAIRDPLKIPVGTKLRISRSLLKYVPSSARLVAVRGNVTVSTRGATSTASSGVSIAEGATLRTSASSFATFSLENGSRISLPSNSDLTIVRLRRYTIDSSIDYDFDVGRGGAQSKVTPLKNANDRYSVKTPKAVSAVRGTDFQSRFDEATGQSFAEVTEGGLAVALPGGNETGLPAGNGLAVTKDNRTIQETLLPAVSVENAGRLQNKKQVEFALPPGKLKVTLAADAGFVDQIAEARVDGGTAAFSDIDDGNYFLRVRPVSESGIEGLPATYAFKRRLNSVTAQGGRGDLGYMFKWIGEGRGKIRYHFQLFSGATDGMPIVDEAELEASAIGLSDLPPGDYYWRVASVQYLDGEKSSDWTAFEKLTVSAN